MSRYRFGDFQLSPRRRLLLRDGRELPLIPRYFDLLVFLVEHRHEAVHRQAIFDKVWNDVIVSDSALSQAIRTLRRTLGDDPREPRFIRTVSRHGYRFVFAEVLETSDEDVSDAFEPLLERVTREAQSPAEDEEQREAAELLHSLGTAEALRRLGTRPGHARARALLRDTRWDSPAAASVPVLGAPAPFTVAREVVASRLRRAGRIIALRWAGASIGGGLAGVIGGAVGGLILIVAPESMAPVAVVPVLAAIGGACGALGGAGVGAGLSVAEASVRSQRGLALACGAALGGAIVGSVVQWVARWTLEALVGVRLETGGGLEGLVIGGAAGLGYALATPRLEGGLAAPRGRSRLLAAAFTAALCGVGALGLTLSGRPLVGGTLHALALHAQGSQITLAPLGRLIGEPDFGPITQSLIGTGEGALFGFGLALGLMRRPFSRTSHETLREA